MAQPNYRFGFGGYDAGTWGNPPIEFLTLDYYLKLVTSEYRNSPKFLSWLLACLRPLDDANECLASFVTSFDLDFAVGVQLDALGVIIGQSRTVGFQPSGGVSPVLTDTTYRTLLKARILQNQWSGTINSLYTSWQLLFPGGRITIVDNHNMTATIILSGAFDSIMSDLIQQGYIVPRPETVQYDFAFATTPIFSVDFDNSLLAGVDMGFIS